MTPNPIDHRLKNAWLRQLQTDWRCANGTFFKNEMRLPQLRLSAAEQVLGRWQGAPLRCLSISTVLIQSMPWDAVQEVLYHEMVHQYVEEVLGVLDERPHGAAFQRLCLAHGIDASAAGDLSACKKKRHRAGSAESRHHNMINKINKLLALAGSANVHEAESAMRKAHTLLLKHNLGALELNNRSHYVHKQIGVVGRRNPIKSMLSAILSEFFFVETLWTFGYDALQNKRGAILELYGTPENIEIAEYIHGRLLSLSERLWLGYKARESLRGNRHRRSFIYGLLNGFYAQLDGLRVAHRGNKLVWTGDPCLKAYFRKRNPRLVLTASQYSKSSQAAYHRGIAQGKALIIHKAIHKRGSGAIQSLR